MEVMSNVLTRIENSSDGLVKRGLRLKEMLADRRIDERELLELADMADQLLDLSLEVEDVALDIAEAKQTLTIGRARTPNRPLQERERRLELLMELSARRGAGKEIASTKFEFAEAVHQA